MNQFDFIDISLTDILDILLVALLLFYLYKLVKGTVDIAGAIIPRDRNVAVIDIDTVITPFGAIGLMVIDPDIMPDNTAFILDLAYIQPVFTNIPGYGTVFVRDLDQDANARIGKAIYMEMGFEFGPPSYHCKIQAVS